MAEEQKSLVITPFVQLIDEPDIYKDKTMLDGYLEQELNSLVVYGDKNDTNHWKNAKEQLGQKFITRDVELEYYKKKSSLLSVVNIILGASLVGLFYLKK